jgi:carbonic anhydrase
MPDIVYRFDPDGTKVPPPPADAEAARARLLEGNRRFVNLFTEPQVVHVAPSSIGIGSRDAPQRPFASILGCSDARVPVEMVFHCMGNELFVVRVAGNVPGAHCLGSLEYAAAAMAQTLRLTVVLGHTGCGAVTSAVDTYLDMRHYPKKSELRTVVDGILPAVAAADAALQKEYGSSARTDAKRRSALIESAVILNVALTAMSVREALVARWSAGSSTSPAAR